MAPKSHAHLREGDLPTALALIVLVCAPATPALALDPDRTLAQLHHTAWTVENGAPSQIAAITQTRDGYLWVGSARGLFRLDGVIPWRPAHPVQHGACTILLASVWLASALLGPGAISIDARRRGPREIVFPPLR